MRFIGLLMVSVCATALIVSAQENDDRMTLATFILHFSFTYSSLASFRMAILRVDPKTNATQLLIRTPKKMHVPIHWHSANETHTVILGTAVFEHEGKREQLGPGGFNYIPANMQHQAWTSDGGVVFITVHGAWDVNWIGNPPSKTDLGQTPPAGSK